jgi:hypothetical protein
VLIALVNVALAFKTRYFPDEPMPTEVDLLSAAEFAEGSCEVSDMLKDS